MAGPSFDDQLRDFNDMIGYIKRGTEGEAGMELHEAIDRHRTTEVNRWRQLVTEYPHAITGIDPAESLQVKPGICKMYVTFLRASHEWLKQEFANNPTDYWEEVASFGCYWVRFKTEADLAKFKTAFSNELKLLEFKQPENETGL